jgi:hypothetical protein
MPGLPNIFALALSICQAQHNRMGNPLTICWLMDAARAISWASVLHRVGNKMITAPVSAL